MKKAISTKTVVIMALFTALCYVGTLLNIPFSIGGAKTMIHFGNIFCVLAALTIGGVKGGICGSIGMGLYDLFSPGYQLYVPQTVILKFGIGLICGVVYHKTKDKIKNQYLRILLSAAAGMLFNVIFDPIASFLTSNFIMGITKDVSTIIASWSAATTLVNAVIAVIVASVLFAALKPALEKSGYLSHEK